MECQIFSNVITFAIRKATKEILDYEIIWGLCWMQGKEIQFLLALGELVINWDNSLIKSNLPSGGFTKEPICWMTSMPNLQTKLFFKNPIFIEGLAGHTKAEKGFLGLQSLLHTATCSSGPLVSFSCYSASVGWQPSCTGTCSPPFPCSPLLSQLLPTRAGELETDYSLIDQFLSQ